MDSEYRHVDVNLGFYTSKESWDWVSDGNDSLQASLVQIKKNPDLYKTDEVRHKLEQIEINASSHPKLRAFMNFVFNLSVFRKLDVFKDRDMSTGKTLELVKELRATLEPKDEVTSGKTQAVYDAAIGGGVKKGETDVVSTVNPDVRGLYKGENVGVLLNRAVEKGSRMDLLAVLEYATPDEKRQALLEAIKKGALHLVILLVEKGAPVEDSIIAACGSDPAQQKIGAYLKSETREGKRQALLEAIEKGNLDIVRDLVQNGMPVEDSTIAACGSDPAKQEIDRYLIEAWSDNATAAEKRRALLEAIKEGKLDIMKALVENGAPVGLFMIKACGNDVAKQEEVGKYLREVEKNYLNKEFELEEGEMDKFYPAQKPTIPEVVKSETIVEDQTSRVSQVTERGGLAEPQSNERTELLASGGVLKAEKEQTATDSSTNQEIPGFQAGNIEPPVQSGDQILSAARARDWTTVNSMLQGGLKLSERDTGRLLDMAITGGEFSAVKKLVDNGFKPSGSVLASAIYGGNQQIIDFLLETGVRLDFEVMKESIRGPEKRSLDLVNSKYWDSEAWQFSVGGWIGVLSRAVEKNDSELVNGILSNKGENFWDKSRVQTAMSRVVGTARGNAAYDILKMQYESLNQ